MQYYTYLITNLIDGKRYTGKTNDIKRRWKEHKTRAHAKETYLARAMVKHGFENFSIIQLGMEGYETEKEAMAEEIRWIANHKELGFSLYNLTEGGDGMSGHKHTPETIAKMSAIKSNQSAETRSKISAALKGNTLCKGRIVSAETRAKTSATRLNNKPSLVSRKPVIATDETGKSVSFLSVKECAQKLNIDRAAICKCLKGTRKSAKKHTFRYAQ